MGSGGLVPRDKASLTPFTLFLDSKPQFGEGKGVSHLLCLRPCFAWSLGEAVLLCEEGLAQVRGSGSLGCAPCWPPPWGSGGVTVDGPGKALWGWDGERGHRPWGLS